MTEGLILLLFSAILMGFVLTGAPLVPALIIGYLIFAAYALFKGFTPGQLARMSLSGVRTVRNILILFLMIGMLTALWRMAGTIPSIVFYSSGLIRPSVLFLVTFLLNCLVSFLTGTAFGTAATMGVICMTMAAAMDISPALAGGAVLSGIFFGDRCSPVSTSALLVAELTGTDLYQNIRRMAATSLIPFLITCAVYGAMGFLSSSGKGADSQIPALFAQNFRLGLLPLLPAFLILFLALFQVNVKKTMAASVLASIAVCLFYQQASLPAVLRAMALGYRSPEPLIAPMIDGGGIVSMVNVTAIVCLTSLYAGIFQETGLLGRFKEGVAALAGKTSGFAAIFLTSGAASLIACNQTLAIMLTHQLCDQLETGQELAIDLEDTAVVIPPLIPWSIAGAMPLASIGGPLSSIPAAFYLYLLPLWRLAAGNRSLPRSVRKM